MRAAGGLRDRRPGRQWPDEATRRGRFSGTPRPAARTPARARRFRSRRGPRRQAPQPCRHPGPPCGPPRKTRRPPGPRHAPAPTRSSRRGFPGRGPCPLRPPPQGHGCRHSRRPGRPGENQAWSRNRSPGAVMSARVRGHAHGRAQAAEHFRQHMIRADQDGIRADLRRRVPVAEMPCQTRRQFRRRGGNPQHRLRPGGDLDPGSVGAEQAVSLRHGHGLGQVEQQRLADRCLQPEAATVPVVEGEAHTTGRLVVRPVPPRAMFDCALHRARTGSSAAPSTAPRPARRSAAPRWPALHMFRGRSRYRV